MGLLLCCGILVTFYILKLACPEFIVGVAELPMIVAIGDYVASNSWLFYIFHFVVSYLGWFLYCCACCRQTKLTTKQNIILVINIISSILIQEFLQEIYNPYNYVSFILVPFLMVYVNKTMDGKKFISTIVCFSVDIMSQALSLVIRNVIILTTCVNPATMIILLIDTWVWRTLLYLFFNYKYKEN